MKYCSTESTILTQVARKRNHMLLLSVLQFHIHVFSLVMII